jgi:hypothetical protein
VQHRRHLFVVEVNVAGAAQAGWNVGEESIGQRLFHGLDIAGLQASQQAPNATRNIETNTSARYDAAFVCVEGCDSTDRKTVAPMPVGHDIACFHDPWECRNVGCLVTDLVVHAFEQWPVGIEDHWSTHLAGGRQLPLVFGNLLEWGDVHRTS